MENEVSIINQQSVQEIVSSAPLAYAQSKKSHDACISFGQSILDDYHRAGAMNDELDKRMSDYIVRAKKTVNRINGLRSPITKIFDEFRSVFTKLENEVDPGKTGSIPNKMQQLRNQYAAQKLAEEEARRREEEQKKLLENARKQFRIDAEAEYKRFYDYLVNRSINELNEISRSVTLENYADSTKRILNFNCELSDNWHETLRFSAPVPLNLPMTEANTIRQDAIAVLGPQFRQQYRFELESNRDDIIARLPSKKKELEKIAKADAEEAERRKQALAAKEAQEAARKEEERRKQAEEERAKMEMAKKSAEMDGLFGQAEAAEPVYAPKTSAKKKIRALNAEAFPEILGLWWSKYGKTLSVEELSKIFKSQVTFCEKLANGPESVTIESEHIEYVDEVKAK